MSQPPNTPLQQTGRTLRLRTRAATGCGRQLSGSVVRLAVIAAGLIEIIALGCSSRANPESTINTVESREQTAVSSATDGTVLSVSSAEQACTEYGVLASGYWTPDASVVEEIEARLRAEISNWQLHPETVSSLAQRDAVGRSFVAGELLKIEDHYSEYQRQYAGYLTSEGSRRVLVISFPRGNGVPRSSANLEHPIAVLDGGFWYWHVHYDKDLKMFVHFDSNGYA